MIKEFTANGYKYVLAGPVLVVSKVKLNGVDISKYLSNNTKISWYDASKNSGRDVTNADGTMVLNVINTKWRIDLVSRPLTDDEMIGYFLLSVILSNLFKMSTTVIKFCILLSVL